MKHVLNNNRGQAIVEFVLIIPLVFLLIFGLLETGRFLHAAYEVEHGSREGARMGAIGGSDIDIQSAVVDSTSGLDQTRISIQVTPTGSIRHSGDRLQVIVTYKFMPITPFVDRLFSNEMNISGTTSMRVE
ncbi:TadE/TadG family type IV pilus assembly protein [Fusibacter sp. JL216-2]|uniref:TadE/TadG family type IV pilus assembly protein n=1 Tax=Fusibacter sp. JL216-2 TaxID=3071453 RepID=UPI003D340B87